MRGIPVRWLLGIATALGVVDGVFGGGERLYAIYNFVLPPKPDESYSLTVLDLGFMPDKFEKTGKRSVGMGLSLYNRNEYPLYYKVDSADYSIDDFQNVSAGSLPAGRVLARKMEPVEFSAINMGFKQPIIYKGEAKIRMSYGKNEHRLGNRIFMHAAIRYDPRAPRDQQFSYGLYPDSTVDVRSTMADAWVGAFEP